METYMQVMQKIIKYNIFMDLHAGIAMDLKNQQLLQELFVGIAMDVKKPTIITKHICGYCNGCKKISNYYKTYLRVLQWM